RMALRRGAGFVRVVLLVVVAALVAKLGWDQWSAR
ncbi:sulfite exporter TauE/SafE family protein, partial [Micromonospora sp. KC606]